MQHTEAVLQAIRSEVFNIVTPIGLQRLNGKRGTVPRSSCV